MSTLLFKVYQFVSFILFYLAPLVVILVVHSISFKHLKRRAVFQISSNEGNTHARRSKENQNILKIFRSVTSGFFICWTPLHIYLVLKSSHPTIFSDDKCLLFAGLSYYIFPLISTAFNPFILNSFSSNYRATVNLNTYSLNVSLFLSVASTKFILQNKSQTSKLNSIGIKNKGNKSKPGGWLRYILVISIGTSVPAVLDWSSRLKFYVTSTHQQGWAWWEWLQFICQASKETPFFKFKSYFTNIF